MNITLLENVRALLFTSGLPEGFWEEALATATYLVIRSSNRALAKIPLSHLDFCVHLTRGVVVYLRRSEKFIKNQGGLGVVPKRTVKSSYASYY